MVLPPNLQKLIKIFMSDSEDDFYKPLTPMGNNTTDLAPQSIKVTEKTPEYSIIFSDDEQPVSKPAGIQKPVEKKPVHEIPPMPEKKPKKSKVIPYNVNEGATVQHKPRTVQHVQPTPKQKPLAEKNVQPKRKIIENKPSAKVPNFFAVSIFEKNSNSGSLKKPQVSVNGKTPLTDLAQMLDISDSFQVPAWFQKPESSENVISDETARDELIRFTNYPVFEE